MGEVVAAAGEAEEERVEGGRVGRGGRGGDSDELERKERVRLRGHQLVQPRRRDRRRRREHWCACDVGGPNGLRGGTGRGTVYCVCDSQSLMARELRGLTFELGQSRTHDVKPWWCFVYLEKKIGGVSSSALVASIPRQPICFRSRLPRCPVFFRSRRLLRRPEKTSNPLKKRKKRKRVIFRQFLYST